MSRTTRDQKDFYIKVNKSTIGPQSLPSFLPYLIRIKNYFWAHFYFSKYEMKLESDKEHIHSMVLYIGTGKRLNDYYPPRV
jgi:hypothetical protein